MNRKIAFLFSGQGSQAVGMGKELYENIEVCRECFDKGEDILGMPIKEIIFDGPQEMLTRTENTQPAILLTSLACLKALENEGIYGEYAAGLSLGEYTALIYGGALTFDEGLRLIKERGRIMGTSLPEGLGGMAAVLKLDSEKVNELLSRASEFGIIEGANYNCPGQVVVAGELSAIKEVPKLAKELGGMAIPLKVSGPFHSSLLKEASEEFYKSLQNSEITALEKFVYSNVKGKEFEANDDIKDLLKQQMMSPVYFENIIRDMISKGVNTFVEIGPGKALTGFVKKIDNTVTLLNVENLASLEATINELRG